ncbi:MAG: DUF5615 family PIN-like protein [Candidatus Obscuribacterales bacterium]
MDRLLDTCVAPRAIDQLEAAGHDVVWIGHESDPGDEEIIERAFKEERVLVTFDKDFGLADHAEDLQAGAIITVIEHRLRKRRPQK